MEVDRVYADGRNWNGGGKKGDKGKGKNGFPSKGNAKGKVKGKTKTKDGKDRKGSRKVKCRVKVVGGQSALPEARTTP